MSSKELLKINGITFHKGTDLKMKKGDLCFFYHSVKERDIVGIVKVTREYHPDPTDKSNRFGSTIFTTIFYPESEANLVLICATV